MSEQTVTEKAPVITVRNLIKDFPISNAMMKRAYMRAVNDVNFDLVPGEALAIVGESGSGKSTNARMLSQIYGPSAGEISFKGLPLEEYVSKYGKLDYARRVQMIFQDPFGSLNPVHTIFHHIARPLLIHKRVKKGPALRERVLELLEQVGLTPAKETAEKYPHELSGGQRQRVAIARALAVDP